jgi:tetratricopeptide (TPR) repeat protein
MEMMGWMVAILLGILMGGPSGGALTPAPGQELTGLRLAQHHFYSARYVVAAETAAPLTKSGPDELAAYELRTSALHFQIKRLLGDATNKGRALKQCTECAGLLDAFMKDVTAGKAKARAILKTEPQNTAVLFYLGKIDLNYVWMQLSTLGRRTGWGEYWNARRSMDAVLKLDPKNTRARVARAWIDYIVDTRVPFGTQWILGGGDRKRALRNITEAAAAAADPFDRAEAEFGLWEMLVQEKRRPEAVEVAKRLLRDFPDNTDLQRFVK